MDNPLVSVITPCYNSERYVARYLDCLLRQTYRNIQLILVNDGSVDRTEEIVKGYEEKLREHGVQLTYRYQGNTGLGGAINAGLKLIAGEFFTWCDSDNLLTNDYFEENVRYFLAHPEAMIVRCDGYNVMDSDITKPLSRMSDGIKDRFATKLFLNCLTCREFYFGCTMLRTTAFDAVNPSREIYPSREGQNWQIMLPMFYRYESHYIDKPMFYFVIRQDSISHAAMSRGMEARLAQNNEYKKIEETVIKSMGVPEEQEYLAILCRRFALIRFWIADEYGNLEILRKEYQTLKQNGWATDIVEKAYRRWQNPLWRLGHSLKGKRHEQHQ